MCHQMMRVKVSMSFVTYQPFLVKRAGFTQAHHGYRVLGAVEKPPLFYCPVDQGKRGVDLGYVQEW